LSSITDVLHRILDRARIPIEAIQRLSTADGSAYVVLGGSRRDYEVGAIIAPIAV
jgi:hypothetical protein